jgi:hypothetical protein
MEGALATLAEQLSTLKEEGANLLVLSGGYEGQSCHGLLGDDRQDRRRLYVTTESTVEKLNGLSAERRRPDRFAHVHVAAGETRSSAARSGGEQEDSWTPATVSPTKEETYSQVADPTNLTTLSRHVHEHLVRFEGDQPDPGEIRLCFDSLDPVVDAVEKERLEEFLRVLTTRVTLARGLAHYHLSLTAARQVPDTIAPIFDGVIERRQTPEGPRQRWTLRESGVQTDWIPIRR